MSGVQWTMVVDTIDDMSRLTSMPQVAAMLKRAAGAFGFNFFGINGLPTPDVGSNPVILTEITPAGFRDCYVAEGLYLVDHICARARVASETFRYSEAPYAQARSRHHARFMEVLETFGLGRGLVVPVGRPARIPACVWLAGQNPALDDETKHAVQMIASFAASKVYSLSRLSVLPPRKLTAREREVMQWISAGKTSWEIGEILHIAKRTVDEHVQTAMRKIDAANRTHAVAIAVRDRLIDI